MPSIKREDKQVQALNEITDELNEIKILNGAISGKLGIAVVVEQSSRKTMKVKMDSKDARRILPVVLARKVRLVKDIRAKAAKYRIDLSTEDLQLMDESAKTEPTEMEQAPDEFEDTSVSEDSETTGNSPGNVAPPGPSI